MTDRLLEVLKNPPKRRCCDNHDGQIDYPEWRKQVLESVEIDEKVLCEKLLEAEAKFILTREAVEYLIANRERWLL